MGLPHGRFAWHMRLEPKVRQGYEELASGMAALIDRFVHQPVAARQLRGLLDAALALEAQITATWKDATYDGADGAEGPRCARGVTMAGWNAVGAPPPSRVSTSTLSFSASFWHHNPIATSESARWYDFFVAVSMVLRRLNILRIQLECSLTTSSLTTSVHSVAGRVSVKEFRRAAKQGGSKAQMELVMRQLGHIVNTLRSAQASELELLVTSSETDASGGRTDPRASPPSLSDTPKSLLLPLPGVWEGRDPSVALLRSAAGAGLR